MGFPAHHPVAVAHAMALRGGGEPDFAKILVGPYVPAFSMKAPGGNLRTPRHRFTRKGSLSRWDVDAKYQSVANHIATLPVRVFFQNKLCPTPVI